MERINATKAQSGHQMNLVKNDHIQILAKSLFLFGFLLFSELSNELGNVFQHSIPCYHGKGDISLI